MKQFIHHKIQKIDLLIEVYNKVRQLYVDRAFEFDNDYRQLLEDCKEFLKIFGTNSQVAEVLNLQSYFETSKKGINPYELIKTNTGRRNLVMMTANQGMNDLLNILNNYYDKEIAKIEEAEDILSNTLLGLIQSGGLSDTKIGELNSIQKIEVFWIELKSLNDSINLIDKKLKIKIISEDIYLIIEKILNKMQ